MNIDRAASILVLFDRLIFVRVRAERGGAERHANNKGALTREVSNN
jgi:hypothetical protein